MDETKVIYHIDDEETPYLVKLPIAPEKVTLADFKNVLNRPNYKYFFKSMDDDFGVVKEEIIEDDAHLPCFNGRVVSWLVSADGSNVSDGTSQCTESASHSDGKGHPERHKETQHGAHTSHHHLSNDLSCTETESVISSRPGGHHGHHESRMHDKYHKYNGHKVNGHVKSRLHGYESSSMLSSDLETTSFLESEDDASSRITTTTGRATNLSIDRNTIGLNLTDLQLAYPRKMIFVERNSLPLPFFDIYEKEEEEDEEDESSSVMCRGRRRAQRRVRRQRAPMSRTSSYSSITDSTMSLNIITVTLNMDTVNFLGISIVGQSNKGGDGGIYVGSIMKGGAVALDGRIEPGDMILQVNDINFEDMSNDEAVKVLREVVQKPGPIKLVVAKCWDPNPKGYFTIPRTEPVRPIDPGAWVAHTAAIRGETYPLRPPSISTLDSNSSSITSSIPDLDRAVDDIHLSVNNDMLTIVRAMARPDSGLEIRDRLWLKITIPNAFIGADVVDWLETHVDGFTDKRDARKYASQMLKAGYIKHTVNKITFSEQCYYIFGDLLSTGLSNLKLDDIGGGEVDTVGPLPPPMHPPSWQHPYATTYLPYGPLSYHQAYTNDASLYGYVPPPPPPREESVHSASGGSSNGSEESRVKKNGGSSERGVRSNSRSSGSSAATATPPQDGDLSASRQSFRIAMGNPCPPSRMVPKEEQDYHSTTCGFCLLQLRPFSYKQRQRLSFKDFTEKRIESPLPRKQDTA